MSGANFERTPKEPPVTEFAKQWQGWGTALKPAHEPIVLARKPLIGTVAANVLTHGTGGLNIDGSRVGTEVLPEQKAGQSQIGTFERDNMVTPERTGRWPANVIHDGSDEVVALFPDTGKSTGGRIGKKTMGDVTNVPAGEYQAGDPGYGDSGSAARFFYCAKASKRDRNEGLDGFDIVSAAEMVNRVEDSAGMQKPRAGAGRTSGAANHHPTVKPTDLMRYLCRLVTPPAGIVLDPFMGSGSTGKAAMLEGFDFIGIDQSAEYVAIAQARIEHAVI
jgi:site-specific DNA-methyltransferase (adenine-specific)